MLVQTDNMMTAIFVYEHPDAQAIAKALDPDNMPQTKIEVSGNRIEVTIKTERLRTLIASCDDLLSNLQVAKQTLNNFREATSK